ncbi:rhamnosyltransferase WsaF family glycosyltransferase [Celeribacter marinus]|uniref:rhamnosyltransferase WsaF family glycosyltransferase n=1 Tax=Celeribacter marinus TaxID=1397108 RepID=UPI003F6BB302
MYGTPTPFAPVNLGDLTQDDLDLASLALDQSWYVSHHSDIDDSGVDPVTHFATIGWREGRAPCAKFDTLSALNVDDAVGLRAYLDAGFGGAWPHLKGSSPTPTKPPEKSHDTRLKQNFDAPYYVAQHGDDIPDTMSPFEYFMTVGWTKNHNPSPDFDTAFYLGRYNDIASSRMNPFEHFILFGRKEGRVATAQNMRRIPHTVLASATPKHLQHIVSLPQTSAHKAPIGTVDFNALNIHWIVPDFARGGGGHMTIFRTIRHLERMGHTCTIWIERRDFHSSATEAYDDIVKYFQCVRADVNFVSPALYQTSGDIVVATGWTTAYIAAACSGFKERFYFVQDHEPDFYPVGAESLLAEHSYKLGLACICASPWLADIMAQRYKNWARPFHLAYDPSVYYADGPKVDLGRTQGVVRICLYARDHTPRRAIALSLMALDILGQRGLPIEVHFFGQDDLSFDEVPYTAYNHGILSETELAALYRACDIGICFSATNYSLIPQEMMACGLPVVELDGDSTRAIFPPDVVTLSGPHPVDIADKLERLIHDAPLRDEQTRAAKQWIAQFSWSASAKNVSDAFCERLTDLGARARNRVTVTERQTVIDVVIPTWNAMTELPPVIDALRGQTGRARPNIICVDSSSTDGTTEWLAAQDDITLKVINQSDFQHGRTRNEAISLGTAPLVALLTQDAIPAHSGWLHDIWAMMEHFPEAAGLFGRHVAYPEHAPFIHHEINSHFANFSKYPLCLSNETTGHAWGKSTEQWAQLLHFYSDNNSCLRRSVWNAIPYPEIDYGEDQVWAHTMIKAGYSKVYAPTATVIHSHDYGPDETYKRSKTEAQFFRDHFGYTIAPSMSTSVELAITREQSNKAQWMRENGANGAEIADLMRVIEQKYRGYADGINAADRTREHR